MKKKKLIPLILILILGIGTAATSYVLINKNLNAQNKTQQIVATNRELTIYEVINSTDLKYVNVPMEMDISNFTKLKKS